MRWAVGLFLLSCSTSSSSSSPSPSAAPKPTVDAAALPSVDSGTVPTPVTTADGGITTLFNGTDFTGWDRYLGIPTGGSAPYGLNNDPKGVYTVVQLDGEPAIHISGEVWGSLITQQEYSTYELHVEYKWGAHQYPPLNAIDSGVMIHSTGPYGAVNAGGNALSNPIGSGAFLVSVEYQVASGDIGGLYNLGPISKTDSARARIAEIPNAWNSIKIVVKGDSSTNYLNDQLVMSSSNYVLNWPNEEPVKLDHGKIQLQCEGAEIYFRHVELWPVTH